MGKDVFDMLGIESFESKLPMKKRIELLESHVSFLIAIIQDILTRMEPPDQKPSLWFDRLKEIQNEQNPD